MKKLISNEFRTSSLSHPDVMREVNELCGSSDDPLELLILLEELNGGEITDEDLEALYQTLRSK